MITEEIDLDAGIDFFDSGMDSFDVNQRNDEPLDTVGSLLQAAQDAVLSRAVERDRGAGERSMKACVEAFNALFGTVLTVEQGWLFMAVLKIARTAGGRMKLDDYIDGAAYFALAGETAAQERRNK